MNSSDKNPTDTQIGKVMICRGVFSETGLIYCRKCSKSKEPLNISNDWNTYTDFEKEHYVSGICSDKCWKKCSEEEIILWKYIHPLYLSEHIVKTQKATAWDKDTGKLVSLPLYDGEKCIAEFKAI